MPKYYYNQLIRKRMSWILKYEQTGNVAQICRYYGISRKTFYKWLNRYEKSGKKPESLLDRSTRPKRSPNETKKKIQKLIKELRRKTKFGPDRLSMFLKLDHKKSLHRSTIYAILKRKGLIRKPRRKAKKKPLLYNMPTPGHLQVDIKMIGGYRPGRFVQYSAIDDCTRIKFTRLYRERSTYNSIRFLAYIIKRFPFKIISIRTDNDSVFTNTYTGEPRTHPLKMPRTHPFTLECKSEEIDHVLNRPSCPQQNGKVERSHRTDSEEFYRLQKSLDYVLIYREKKKYDEFFNNHRPHMGLNGLTPLQKLRSFKEFESVTYVYS